MVICTLFLPDSPNCKNIVILDFVELCSLAFVPLLDDIVGNSFDYLDIGTKKTKELYYYYILQEILPYKKQGLKIIIINSCMLQNNFRYKDNGYNYTYAVLDDDLKISDRKLSDVLNGFWRLLSKNSSYNTIRNKEIDNRDLNKIIKELIGEAHFVQTEIKLEYITDINNKFNRRRKIPQYLKEEIAQVLRNYNLII